jgi:hypothetical protein
MRLNIDNVCLRDVSVASIDQPLDNIAIQSILTNAFWLWKQHNHLLL